jgi:peptidoglycan/LPS O-acetylase OafA/YrhL
MTPRTIAPVRAEENATSLAAHWTTTSVAALSLLLPAALAAGCLLRHSAPKLTNRRRRGTAARWVAVIAAVGCTAYSASTSWQFAADSLDMHNTVERCAFFATGELAMVASAVIARQNLHGPRQAAGLPAVLVWVLAAVLTIPAYAEHGLVGGTWNAFFGPVMAAAMWHMAIRTEPRHHTPATEQHA